MNFAQLKSMNNLNKLIFWILILASVILPYQLQSNPTFPNPRDFLPFLCYEQEHTTFPVSCYFDNDDNFENNSENYTKEKFGKLANGYDQTPTVYTNLVSATDCTGDFYWVIEYHYYYAKNICSTRQTHEHDWEWIYVVLLEKNSQFVPYLITLSCHDITNWDTWENNKYYYYPEFDNVRQLKRVKGTHACINVGADGNAFYNSNRKDGLEIKD